MKFIKSNELSNLLNLLENYDELEYICKLKYGKEFEVIDCSINHFQFKNSKYIFVKGNEIEDKYFAGCNYIQKL